MIEGIERRLAAIVSADVAGYSRLIAQDEVTTVRTLTQYRSIMSDLVSQHRGRVVDNPGDNALLEFPSATDAVECAIAVQKTITDANHDVTTDHRMEFRIGVHLGEVIVEDGRIYGDGVNIAARLEAMAPVGGIVVSKTVHDQVANKVDSTFTSLGEQDFKNIPHPVHAYRLGTATGRAVVSGSVPGLSELMEKDAEGAISSLKAHRTASDPIVLSHGGRVTDTQGARMLFEFPSALEAVKCASDVQALMAGRNATVPVERRMQYQLGVHDGLEADAIATAVEVQESAEPGGVCLSDPIYRQVSPELELPFVRVGELGDGTALWKVAAITSDDPGETHLAGPGILLVLPFERLGGGPKQDYLVDGITEDVTTALSEYGEYRVVPRSSAFAFRDSSLSDRDVARQLDATYILRGSVRATETRVRVSTELVEAESGDMVWSERFDRDYEDVLDLQDDIAHSITLKLAPAVRGREVNRSLNRTGSIDSWDLMQRAKWHYYRATKEDFDRAVDLYEQAMAADSANSRVYAWTCLVLITRIWHGWSDDVAGDFERVHRYASEGIRLDANDWRAHDALATYLMFQTRDFDGAIAEAKHGERFEPGVLGGVYQRAGEQEQAIELLMRDLQTNPNRPDRYHWMTLLAGSHYLLGNYSAALAWGERALEVNPRYIQAVGYQAASLAQLGRLDEAGVVMDRFLEHFSGMTAARYKTRFNYRNEADIDSYMEGLVKAGMPEGNEDEGSPDQRAAWIAVLPFENLSGDPEQDYFSDGIAEEVITGLAAFRSLRVIARTSSFRYRDTNLSVPQIAEELGVRFLLEGSVRRSGNRVRVTAQLIEAPDRHHIWADRYDVALDDVFEAQDQITQGIVTAVDPAIKSDHIARTHPESLGAWDHVQRGWFEWTKSKPEANANAIRHFRAALDLDPRYAQAHALLGRALGMRVWLLWSHHPENDLKSAETHAKRAIELDERDAVGHEALAMVAYARGRMETVIREADRAIQLNPSWAYAYMLGGAGRIHGGDPIGGIPMMTRAVELSPQDPMNTWFYGGRAIGRLLAGHYEDAVVDARQAVATRYGYLMGRVILTVALVQLGRVDEARSELETLRGIDPAFNPDYLARYTFTDEQRDMFASSLETAGLGT